MELHCRRKLLVKAVILLLLLNQVENAGPPHGESFFHGLAGRNCDGRLVIVFIGFEHPLRVCCGHGGKYNFNLHIGCGKVKVKGKDVLVGKACEDPTVMINWDGVHYTQVANKWVSDQIVNGSFSDPPIPLELACHKL